MNENQVKRRVLLRLLGSPVVVGPFLAGMTAMTVFLATGQRLAVSVFAGVAGCLTAAGAYFTRLIFRGERVARKILEEDERAGLLQRQRQLDQLDALLTSSDDDPRPESALRDLRALVQAFDAIDDRRAGMHLPTVIEIRGRVHELFDQCVHSLDQTKRLWETAAALHTPAARQPILQQRERIIADVQATIQQLSSALVGLENLDRGPGSTAPLNRLREELDQSLEVARNIEARVQALLEGPGVPGDFAAPSRRGRSRTESKTKG